jgi:hypothetical protein
MNANKRKFSVRASTTDNTFVFIRVYSRSLADEEFFLNVKR